MQTHKPSVVMATPATDSTTAPPREQSTSAQAQSPSFTLTASQADMSVEVQQACAPLLSRTSSPVLPESVAECVAQAMHSGASYSAEIETSGTGLPGGEHHAQVRTGPEFAALITSDAGTKLFIGNDNGRLSGRNGTVDVDPEGGPDERSAAIVGQAAEILLNPVILKRLLASASSVNVDYAPQTVDAPNAAVRLTGFGIEAIQGVDTVSLELVVDSLYRPVRLDIIGTAQSIPASTSVVYAGWGEPVGLVPYP